MKFLTDTALDHLRQVVDLPDLAGTVYEVVGTIGRGGMATVYLARDRSLDREVALKVMDVSEEAGEAAERTLREARILARLEHPGIVPVHDVGTLPDGRVWYVMKRVRGQRLDEHARTAPLAERLRAFLRICEAVAFAHAHGVIHRDLKPENVMVGPFGEVLVMDWGVAKALTPGPSPTSGGGENSPPPVDDQEVFALFPSPAGGRGAGGEGLGGGTPSPGRWVSAGRRPGRRGGRGVRTAHGTILGTPGYMAPEQERGEVEHIDGRTDVWGLGAILAFLLAADGADEPTPRPLEAIRQRAMAPEPENRYPTVDALASDLALYLDGLPVAAYREGPLERVSRFVRRHRTPILLILAYLIMRMVLLLIFHR